MLLSILIPTTIDRRPQFEKINSELQRQIRYFRLKSKVEIISIEDNKEMTIGEKRNKLYSQANGAYSVQWDSDDGIAPDGLKMLVMACNEDKDCVTYKEWIVYDGKKCQSSNFSLNYPDWSDSQDGYDYVRTPFFKTPIKTEICQSVKVPDIRFGEDHAWARLIKPLLKTETHIDEFIYWYIHNSTPFNERYGIKEGGL